MSKPTFTYDGSELYFIGCDIECFVNINGRKYSIPANLPFKTICAKKPGSLTIAYSSSSSMVVRSLDNNRIIASRVFDKLTQPRYNWRRDEYEALGVINNRLYMIFSKF